MAFFDALRRLFSGDPQPRLPVVVRVEGPTETVATHLADAVASGRLADAVALFRGGLASGEEERVIEAAVMSLREPTSADEPLRIAVARALVERGARVPADSLLADARSPSALVLRADLFEEGLEGPATRRDLDLALSLLARALRLDIDAPGARDRWERLRARLGFVDAPVETSGATLVGAAPALPFTLVREVARGGAGVVYEARETLAPEVERTVALKLSHARGVLRTQLAHEARVAVSFRGEGVVAVYDVDPEAGWLALEWAHGGSLRDRLRSTRDESMARDVPAWLAPLLRALRDVHAAGWVHGDLKPGNVLLASRGALLSDFGLARERDAPATPGTAGYVSPERAAGAPNSPADDVFALGRIFEEILAAGWGAELRPTLADAARRCLAPADLRPRDAGAVASSLPISGR